MNRRFGDHTLPETHRRELQQIRKAAGESFQEYSTRIEAKMSKAYPGMQNTEIYKSLSIEHMLNGIHDQSTAYDVLTERPHTLQEAVNLLSWHFYAKMESRPNSTSDKQQWKRNLALQKTKE